MLACVTAVPGAALSLPPLAFVCPVPQAQERGRPEKGVGGQRRRRRGAGGALSPLPTDAASREPDSGGRQLSRFLICPPLPGWGRGSGWSGAFVSGFGSARVPTFPRAERSKNVQVGGSAASQGEGGAQDGVPASTQTGVLWAALTPSPPPGNATSTASAFGLVLTKLWWVCPLAQVPQRRARAPCVVGWRSRHSHSEGHR